MERLVFTRAAIIIEVGGVKEPVCQSVRRVEGAKAHIDVVSTIRIHGFDRIPRYR
jgi:hypothetical protein